MTITTTTFYIGAYWGSRRAPFSEIVSNTLDTLIQLKETDEIFSHFYRGGSSRKNALTKELSLDLDSIEKLCAERLEKDPQGNRVVPVIGVNYGLWTGQPDGESSGISFNAGGDFGTITLSNCVVLNLPFEGPAMPRLINPAMLRRILSVFVEIWQPDYAIFTSKVLRDTLQMQNNVGYLTFRRSIRQLPTKNSGVQYQQDQLGHWFSVDFENEPIDKLSVQLSTLKDCL